MPNTHCLPTGSLGTGQLPVPQFAGPSVSVLTPAGSKRGVVVLMHGMLTTDNLFPYALADYLGNLYLTLATDLKNDGWVVVWPSEIGDNYLTKQSDGWFGDYNNDAGHGSRLNTSIGYWWDHAINYMNLNYPTFPVVPMGISLGGLHALLIATTKTSTIAGYCGHVPATLVWSAQGIPGVSFNQSPQLSFTLNSSMNGQSFPPTGNNIVVNETISVQNPPATGCLVINTTGGSFNQIVRYASWSGSTFAGITGGKAGNTMNTNGAVTQSSFTSGTDISMTALNSLGNGQQGTVPVGYLGWETGDDLAGYANTLQLYTNANGASAPVTGQARTGGLHQLDATDVTNIMAWVTGTLDPLCPAVH